MLFRLLLSLVVAYVALLVLVWWRQERIVFQPPAGLAGAAVSGVQRVTYRTSDSIDLFGYVVGDPRRAARVVVAFHGNADLARWMVPWAETLVHATGGRVAVFLPELRGYDGCPGRPTYEGAAHDARAALAMVRDSSGAGADRLVLYGHSLGSAIAAEVAEEMAREAAPRALVLESPFSSARAMSARLFIPGLRLFFPFVSRIRFDTRRRVTALDAPVWVAHGDRDAIVPVAMGRDVFAAAKRKGELLVVPGAGHNDVADVGGTRYWGWLARAVME